MINKSKFKIFLLKNHYETKGNLYQKDKVQNRFSSFHSLYANNQSLSRQKDITHLSTLLQRNKKNVSQTVFLSPSQQYELQQRQNIHTKYLHEQLDNGSNEITMKNEKAEQTKTKKAGIHGYSQTINNLQLFTNKKKSAKTSLDSLKRQQKILTQNNTRNDTQFKLDRNDKHASLKDMVSNQNKYYTVCIQQKYKEPNNLAYMFKQKWSKTKLKKNLEKTQKLLKNTFLTQEERNRKNSTGLSMKRNSQQERISNQINKNLMKQNFLQYLKSNQERNVRSLQKQQKKLQKKKNESQKNSMIFCAKINYQDIQSSGQNKFSLSKDNKAKKSIKFLQRAKIVPSSMKSIFTTEFQPIQNRRKSFSSIKNTSPKNNIQTKYNISLIKNKKKRRSIYLADGDQQKSWWSKQKITAKAGVKFQLRNTMLITQN